MFRLTNVSINYGRLKESVRTRMIDGSVPVIFSWGAVSSRPDAVQSACRVRVKGYGLCWDSGWVEQKEQSLRYTGKALPEARPISLEIQIKDDAGQESLPYSDVFYNAAVEWKADWIGENPHEPSRAVYLRRELSIDRPIASAALYACGIGYQKLYVNGAELAGSELDPAYTDYSKTCQYVVYPELEKYLNDGANCIGAIVGEGWRYNVLTYAREYLTGGTCFRGEPMLTAMLKLVYADGDVEWILTDESWQVGHGPIVFNDIFDGVTYDASQSVCGWNKPGYVGFAPVAVLEGPGGVMKPMILNPIIEHRALKPIASWTLADGKVIYDFGQNIAGVLRITLPKKMEKGQTLRMMHSEEIDEDGTLFMAPLRRAKVTDTYIASGDGRDLAVWQPIFTYHGFRYASVEGLDEYDLVDIEAVNLHTDLEIKSTFRCGDALVTQIHENCVATERANQHSILADCPQRNERQGWMNDATVRFEETPYNFDIGRMFPKLIRDLMDTQDEQGGITCTAPYVLGSRPADPVCSSFLVAGLESYRHLGNKDILVEAFDAYAAWENCLIANSDDYIVNYSYYGDWAGPAYACVSNSNGFGAESAVTPGIFMSTGYSYHNCRMLAKFASVLGKADEAAHWDDTAKKVKSALLAKWYDAAEAKVCTGSQACQTFALWLGIVPEEDAPRAAKRLRDDLVECGYRFTTGNLCTRYLMDVLSQYGYLEEAWTLITKQTYPSFGYMIQQEATTIWERFELKKAPVMNSHNHPMFGAVDYWFYAYLCGIQPLEPGYEKILIKPYIPEKLMSAQASVDTVKGEVAVRWMKRYGGLHLHVQVPFGARAIIDFGGEICEVGSGFHTFCVPCEC